MSVEQEFLDRSIYLAVSAIMGTGIILGALIMLVLL